MRQWKNAGVERPESRDGEGGVECGREIGGEALQVLQVCVGDGNGLPAFVGGLEQRCARAELAGEPSVGAPVGGSV